MKTNIALLIEQSVNVIDSLNKGLRLTHEEQQFFCEHFEREEIKKNEFTIRIGDYEKYLYFIESGILRYWTAQEYGDPDKEVTFWFSFPGEFANSYFSLKENQPSLIHIQALTDCVIWKLSKQDLADLYQTSLNINKIARIVLEDALCRKITRETLLLGSIKVFGILHRSHPSKIKSNKEKSSLIRQLIFRSTFALENYNEESVVLNLLYKARNLSK